MLPPARDRVPPVLPQRASARATRQKEPRLSPLTTLLQAAVRPRHVTTVRTRVRRYGNMTTERHTAMLPHCPPDATRPACTWSGPLSLSRRVMRWSAACLSPRVAPSPTNRGMLATAPCACQQRSGVPAYGVLVPSRWDEAGVTRRAGSTPTSPSKCRTIVTSSLPAAKAKQTSALLAQP